MPAERSVRVRFTADVAGAIAGIGKLARSTKDAASAGADYGKKNKASFDGVSRAALGIGVAAAAGVGLAVKRFADFDKAMSSVKAATQESAGNMNLLRDAAMQAGKDTAFSATEAATGIENLAKAGVSTTDILGGGLKGALDLAAAGQIDVGTAAETAATAMTQFGLSGKDIPHVADLLAAGAGKAQGEVTDMAAALKQGGLVSAQFGVSIEETTGTLAAFASAGLIGSDAGTSFKTMLLRLANPSKEAAAAMSSLGINAYDAQGAFIGIAPLADQLKTKLSGLTDEQRNAALATIFGSDAIRAANVLYDQGAAGITGWTNNVNDAGFAAQQARDKTDNLAGDVERLGGALDTALIQGGAGANTVLRGLTQAADGAVSAFADLPPAVSGVATALGAVVAVGGLGAAGVLKAATAAGELRSQWSALGKTGKTLTLSMGAVGIALAAAAVVYGIFAKRNQEAQQKSDDLRSTLDEQTGAITQNTRASVAKSLADSGLSTKARDLGLNLSQVTDAALGNADALNGLVTQLDAVIAAGTRSGAVGNSHKTVLTAEAQAAAQLKSDLIGTNAALTDAQKKQRDAAEGAAVTKTAVQQEAEAHKKAKAAADAQTASLADLITEMLKMPGQVLTLRDAQRQVEAAFDDATDAIKENGRTLDITTPKGRANQAALDDMAKSANDLTKTLAENGGSQKALQGNLNTSRARLVAVAQQMGLSRGAAQAYADKVLAIPPTKKTTVTNNAAAKPKSDVERYTSLLGLVPRSKSTSVSAPGAAAARGQVEGLRGALNSLPKYKSTNVYTNMIETHTVKPVGVLAPGKAGGGQIYGPGTTTSDEAGVFRLSKREWVIQAKASDKYGPKAMASVNAGTATIIPGLAGGGQVGGFDFSTLFRGLFTSPLGNPQAGLDTSATLKAVQAAQAAQKKIYDALRKAQAERVAAISAQNRADAAVKAQQTKIKTMRATGASSAAIDRQELVLIAREGVLAKAKARSKKENTELTAAEKKYAAAINATKKAVDAHVAASEKLREVRKEAADFAKQVADQQLQGTSITDLFSGWMTRDDLLGSLKDKSAGLASFASTLEALQKQGLSGTLLDQLRSAGPGSSDLAQEILAGGRGFISQLNTTQVGLEAQANRIGAGAAQQHYNIAYLTTNISIGNEVVRVVQQQIRDNNAAMARAARQNAGGR